MTTAETALLAVEGLDVSFGQQGRRTKVLDSVSFAIALKIFRWQ